MKALVVSAIVLGAVAASGVAQADKSGPPAAGANECVTCVHECAGTAQDCRQSARHARNDCLKQCMGDFRSALAQCVTLPPGQPKQDCQTLARTNLSTCKTSCDSQFGSACGTVEQECLKDCVQVPTGNNTVPSCQTLCPNP